MSEIKEAIEIQDNCLSLLPLKNVVILPKSIIPIIVGRESSVKAVEFALKHNKSIFVTAQKNPDIEYPTQDEVFHYGTRSTILQVMRMPNNALKILVEGICRSKITKIKSHDEFLTIYYEDLNTTNLEKTVEIEATWRQVQNIYASYAKLNERIPTDLLSSARTTQDMDYLIDTIVLHLTNLTFDERQEILETVDLKERMLKIAGFIKKEIEILETEQRIKGRIQTQVEKGQREYYLTEQIKAIQKELGRDDQASEIASNP